MGNGELGQPRPTHSCRSYTSGRLEGQQPGVLATRRVLSVWFIRWSGDTDLVQGKVRAVPGREVRLSVDAVTEVLVFGAGILPL